MATSVTTVREYLDALPDARRRVIAQVRDAVLANLAPGFEEGIQYGMLAYCVPHSVYPKGYHANPKLPLPYVSLASQKNHMALYLMCLYPGSELLRWFETEWKKTGKKLDLGKSCLRFKTLDDLALDVVVALLQRVTVEACVANYEATLAGVKARKTAAKGRVSKGAAKTPVAKSAGGRALAKAPERERRRPPPNGE